MKTKLLLLITLLSVTLYGQDVEKTTFSLNEAVAYGMENAYEIDYANKDVEIAEQRVRETTAIGLPQVNGAVDYQNYLKQPVSLLPAAAFDPYNQIRDLDDYYQVTPVPGNPVPGAPEGFIPINFGTKQNISASVILNQLIFDGSYLIGLKGVKVYLKQGENAKSKTEFIVKQTITNAYTYVLLVEENLSILEKNKTVLESNLNQTLKLVENGFSEEQDAQQLQLTLSAIINEINSTNRVKASAYKLLNLGLGLDINTPITLTETLESLLVSNLNLGLTSQDFDITNHIDYQIANTNKESSELLMRFEKSKYLPSLNGFVNVGTAANNDQFQFFNNDQKWFASSVLGVNLSVPIFSSFSRDAKTQQAKIDLLKAETQLTETEQRLTVELQDARNDYQFAVESYNISKDNMALAESIEGKENTKFFEGVSTSFDLSNAQNQLYSRQREYLESILYLINSRVTLENALNIK
ncbi:TolC family protein [Urechidicola vernalis]|uniref:TolC family protein n=1 Tax=Urechidicola vernalis TaxID=3075600 RepID=A0ABU2Y4P3_9FLAO|nr:TolC family protein [Urechidicola sp. P050]MDT0553164.1 TolC family protein [Urechidicola sp. P050]